jgi:hypothetical protein
MNLFVLFNYLIIPANFLNLLAKLTDSLITALACAGFVDLTALLAIPSEMALLVNLLEDVVYLKFSLM